MISEPTVLVLGAGASKDWNFPLGWDLKKEICQMLRQGTQPLCGALAGCGFDVAQQQLLAECLAQSAAASVDAFLEHRPDLIAVGKAAIAGALIPYENSAQVHLLGDAPRWLDVLFHRMRAPLDQWSTNKLSIVTFNYDRLVEQHLTVALVSQFNLNAVDATALFRRTVRIIHVHGMLGDFAFGAGAVGRAYNPHISAEIIRGAAEKIRIVHEGGDHDDVFVEARQLLQLAKRVVIMGFGYDATNAKRIGLCDDMTGKRLVGSAIGLSSYERFQTMRLSQGQQITLSEADNLVDFLRSSPTVGN